MRKGALAILIAWTLACGPDAVAQALTESGLLNSQSAQGATNAGRQMPHVIPPGLPLSLGKTTQGQTITEFSRSAEKRPFPQCGCASEPSFSTGSGDLGAGALVTITSSTPNAAIFYTTDGWTPTEASTRYTGPIAIQADTRLQAFAKAPDLLPSAIAETNYTVTGPVNGSAIGQGAAKPQRVEAVGGVLPKGTALRLITGEDVASDTAQVGDRIRLLLDENVVVGDTVVAAKGSAVDGTITRVVRAGLDGKPGVIAFEVQALHAHEIAVPLRASLTLAARDPRAQEQKIANASQVHVAGSLPAGDEAEIEPGMALTAWVGADTALHP